MNSSVSRGRASGEGQSTRLGKEELAVAKRMLRGDIGNLTDKLGALLPQYWSWVEPPKYKCDRDQLLFLSRAAEDRFLDLPTLERLHHDLSELERTFTAALTGPLKRKRRKIFI